MTAANPDFSTEIASSLPYLRRYARALTGSQEVGDRYAAATLEAIVADPGALDRALPVKVALFRAFHAVWSSSGARIDGGDGGGGLLESRAQWRLRQIAPNTREALLLRAIEGFGADDIAAIMDIAPGEAEALVTTARNEMAEAVAGDVLVIEDEAIIAMDLQSIVASMGHNVTGIARTLDGALALGRKRPPDLILADIQLADKSSGIDAVNTLLAELGERPVIFITAFPERLLTGERPEPAFLISKPYGEEQVRASVSQAMFFASTESLEKAG